MKNDEKFIIVLILAGIIALAFSRKTAPFFSGNIQESGVNAPYYLTYNVASGFTGGSTMAALSNNGTGLQNSNGGQCDSCSLFPSIGGQL